MYFNFFMIIYNKNKIIIKSLCKIMEKGGIIFYKDEKEVFLTKLSNALNIFYNFLNENELYMCYDINCILFLKINSFLSKIFKKLLSEKNCELLSNLIKDSCEEKEDIIYQFFKHLISVIDSITYTNNKEVYDSDYFNNYLYEIAMNRKGFHYEEVKNNITTFFNKYKNYKDITDFLSIKLNNIFQSLCKEEDALDESEVNDNSIEVESRTVCSICQMDEPELDAHLKDCGHQYHMDCIKQLIKSNSFCSNKCPVCKRTITGIKEDPYFII